MTMCTNRQNTKRTLRCIISTWALVLFTSPLAWATSYHTERWETQNGVRVVFYPAAEVPILDISLVFAAGSAYDGPDFGLSSLTTQMINQGNGGLSVKAIAEKIEKTGAQFSADTTRDMMALHLRALSKSDALNESIEAFRLIINQPDFPEAAFNQQKNQQLMAIKQQKESPDELANQAFYKTLYQDHPYAHPVIGDEAHVQAITRTQLVDFYHRYVVGQNAVLVLVGAIDSKAAHQIAEQLVSALPKGSAAPPLPKAAPLKENQRISLTFPASQTVLRIGQLGIDHENPHYFPLIVGNNILGGASLVSMLGIELREKRGLTYGVYSQFIAMPGIGPFVISLSTRNSQAEKAATLTKKILNDFITQGPDEKTLKANKQFLTGGFPLSLASNRNIADILIKIAFYHLPDNFLETYVQRINAVTASDVKVAFQSQFTSRAFLEVSVGKT